MFSEISEGLSQEVTFVDPEKEDAYSKGPLVTN